MSNYTDRRRFMAIAMAAGGPLAATPLIGQASEPSPHTSHTAYPSFDSLYTTSLAATSLTGEAADRIAIRELVDAWAHCADRRLFEKQAALFTKDGVCIIYGGDPATHQATGTLRGQAEILAALPVLNKLAATTHFNGQSVIVIEGEHAVGETYCLAHQLLEEGEKRTLQILSIRYLDRLVREGRRWLFSERKLIIDWSDTRPSAA